MVILKKKTTKGFTLIEMLLYLALMSIVITAASVILNVLIASRLKSQAISEVEQQGVQVLQMITQSIRNSDAVNSPVMGANAASISLDVYTLGDDPTVYDLSTGELRITEGAGSPIPLNSSKTVISNLLFENVSRASTPGTIRIKFDISFDNQSGNVNYDYSKTFRGSASLR